MARTVIGLDVGTAGVRAAELRFGRGSPVLRRFGQVALEPGAVVAGEVVDVPAVSAALRRLWKEGGFGDRHVVTAVSGARVVARMTELPAMTDSDLRSSLPFQIQEIIPIPLDEAVVDYQVLEPFVDAAGAERLRVFVVAAHRDMVRSLLAALEGAGLVASRIDLLPFALIRALHDDGFSELGEGASGAVAEAIVDIGAGLTNVVIHERGVPRFVRTLPIGGGEVTAAVATDLDVATDVAELLKRRANDDADTDVEVSHARQIAAAALSPVLEEIHSSLDYWQAQTFDEQLRRVVLVGGASRPPAVAERLALLVGMPVDRGTPLDRLGPADAGLVGADLEAAQAVGAVAVGLARSGETLASGERRISLLPTELAARRRERRQVALAGVAVAAFAALLLAVFALRGGRVSDAQRTAARAEAHTTGLQQQISSLADVESLQADIAGRRQSVVAVLAGDIAWTRLIQQVATVMPSDVWITTFSGSRASATGPGQVSFAAMGFDHTSTAHWLIRIGGLEALTGVWVPSSAKSTGAVRDLVGFSSNASLAPAAESARAKTYAGDG